jgi:hypothetical protein
VEYLASQVSLVIQVFLDSVVSLAIQVFLDSVVTLVSVGSAVSQVILVFQVSAGILV